MVIRGVLWDFGGVITTSPFEAFLEYERSLGVPEGLIRGINATNPDTNAWAQLERSEVDLDQFCVLFEAEASALGHTVEGRRVLACQDQAQLGTWLARAATAASAGELFR